MPRYSSREMEGVTCFATVGTVCKIFLLFLTLILCVSFPAWIRFFLYAGGS